MGLRGLLWTLAIVIAFTATPGETPIAASIPTAPEVHVTQSVHTAAEFAQLVQKDVLAAMEVSMQRARKELRDYRCLFLKQERIGGKWGAEEQIQIRFRLEPYAVLFRWKVGGTVKASVYLKGENNGQMQVLKSVPFLGDKVITIDPLGPLARAESRYAITDFGFYASCQRTYTKWKAARDRGQLQVEYLGQQAVPELGGRVCHLVRRTCNPSDIDNFTVDDTVERSPEKNPNEQIHTVTLYLDVENWQQVGSVLMHPDGKPLGRYFFKDIEWNPKLDRTEFHLKP